MSDVKLSCGCVCLTITCEESAVVNGAGKPSPDQWAAFIAAVLQALLALFGHPNPPPPPPQLADKPKK